jgi:hypothetical protein
MGLFNYLFSPHRQSAAIAKERLKIVLAHERAGRKNLDLDAAAGRGTDRLRKTNGAGVKARQSFGPVGHHLQLSDALGDRGRREAHGRAASQ